MARLPRLGHRRSAGARGRATSWRGSWSGRASRASASLRWSPPTTSTPSRPSRSRGSRATRCSSGASAPTSGGTRWRWSTGRTTGSTGSAATSPRSRRPPRSTTSASTTSSGARATAAPATRCSSRVTRRRASTPAPSSRAGSPRSTSTASAVRSTAAGLPSYPHPRRMPKFWEFPTVSMGLGPLNAVAQARFNRYLMAPRDGRHQQVEGVGVRRRRRDGRARGDGRLVDRGPRAARQPDLRRQLQPAAPRRSGARQRQDHPGARSDLPRRGLERDQGDLGPRLGRPARARRRRRARQPDEQHRRRPVPEVRGRVAAPTSASTSSVPTRACSAWSSTSATTTSACCRGAATTTASCTRPTRWRSSTRAARPSSWPRRSRGGRSAPASSRATRPTRSRSSRADELKAFRDRLQLPIPDSEVDDGDPPFWHPGTDSPEFEYMMARRRALGGSVPERVVRKKMFSVPVRDPDEREPGAVRRRARGHRREGAGEHHDRVRPTAAQPAARSRHRRPHRADHPRRSAHVRSRRAVPRVQDLRAVRPALRAGRRRAAALVPRGAATAASSRKGSPRPARWRRSPPPARRTRRGASR